MNEEGQIPNVPLNETPTGPIGLENKPKRKLWPRILFIIGGLLVLLIGFGLTRYYIQEKAIANLAVTGSAEYKAYIESIDKIGDQWMATEAQMKTQDSSAEDIELAKRQFFEFFASTILLKIKFEGTNLSETEKISIGNKLQELTKNMKIDPSVDTGCEYTEQKLPLQDFFVGATIKFKKPMLYIDWKEEKAKYCSPSFAAAKYYSLESASQWNSTIFDKEGRGIKDYKIDPSVTFTLEGRIKLHSRSLFSEGDSDHYILKDSNGIISVVPYFYIFDQYYKEDTIDDGESGAQLYKNDKYIGYVVSDITSGGVWIHGNPIPQDVVNANTPKKPTSFPSAISKKTEFMQRMAVAIDDGKFVNYTSLEIIKADLGKDLYSYKNGEVINDFGGKVTLKKSGDYVSVIFDNIPKGEDCFQFYYVNDPDIYGFKQSYINGVLEQYARTESTLINDFKQKVCFPATGTANIEFRGNLNDIKSAALWIRKQYDPRYSNASSTQTISTPTKISTPSSSINISPFDLESSLITILPQGKQLSALPLFGINTADSKAFTVLPLFELKSVTFPKTTDEYSGQTWSRYGDFAFKISKEFTNIYWKKSYLFSIPFIASSVSAKYEGRLDDIRTFRFKDRTFFVVERSVCGYGVCSDNNVVVSISDSGLYSNPVNIFTHTWTPNQKVDSLSNFKKVERIDFVSNYNDNLYLVSISGAQMTELDKNGNLVSQKEISSDMSSNLSKCETKLYKIYNFEFVNPCWELQEYEQDDPNNVSFDFFKEVGVYPVDRISFNPKSTGGIHTINEPNTTTSEEKVGGKNAKVVSTKKDGHLYKTYYLTDPIDGWQKCNTQLTNYVTCGKIQYFASHEETIPILEQMIKSIQFK